MIMEMGKPTKNMELIKPNCVAVSPKSVPTCGNTPARILNENAVVMSAKQLARNRRDGLTAEFIDGLIVGFIFYERGL